MEEKVNFAAVGAFVIVLTVTMIAGVLWLSSGKYYRKSYDTYETYMTESVSGLNLNAPVRYRGVDVGRVRRIALAPGNVGAGAGDARHRARHAGEGGHGRDAADAGTDRHRLSRADRGTPRIARPAREARRSRTRSSRRRRR